MTQANRQSRFQQHRIKMKTLSLFFMLIPIIAEGGETYKCMEDDRVIHPATPCSSSSVPLKTSIESTKPNSVSVLIDDYGHYVLSGKIKNKAVKFVLDTGASSTVISKKSASKLNIQSCIEAGTGSSANGKVNVCKTRVSTLSFGGFEFSDVSLGVLPDLGSAEALLGNDLLSKFKVEIENGVMTLSH